MLCNSKNIESSTFTGIHYLATFGLISPYRLTESHQISPYLTVSLTESCQVSPNLIESHQISLYLTKTKCQSRTSCGTILLGGSLKKKIILLYFANCQFVFFTRNTTVLEVILVTRYGAIPRCIYIIYTYD